MDQGESKIYVVSNTSNTLHIQIKQESHTIGSILKAELINHRNVCMASYLKPHTQQDFIQLKIKTNSKTSPIKEILTTCTNLLQQLRVLDEKFVEKLKDYESLNKSYNKK